jgi:hypothetical protein
MVANILEVKRSQQSREWLRRRFEQETTPKEDRKAGQILHPDTEGAAEG